MKYDAYYVSLLSESYRNGKPNSPFTTSKFIEGITIEDTRRKRQLLKPNLRRRNMKQYSWIGLVVMWSLAMSCATQTTPMGGPKDTIPPTPSDIVRMPNQTNYRGKEIAITFSEAIQLNNPKEEIIIIPSTVQKTEYNPSGEILLIVPENKTQRQHHL